MIKDPLRVVSVTDPAVDLESMGTDVSKYAQERDPDLVKTVPGDTATWFHVRRIPTSVYQSFISSAPEHEQNRRAFQVGCVLAENVHGMDGEFRASLSGTGKVRTSQGEAPAWKDEELELFPPVYVDEIGSVARMRSMLHPKALVFYRPPLTCLLALGSRISQLAASRATSAEAATSETPRPPGASQADSDSGAPTGAPVTGKATGDSAKSKTATRRPSARRSKR